MENEQKGFSGWCVLELLGYRRLGGKLTEEKIAGASFLRIDIPAKDGAIITQYYSPGSVYCITPTTEEIARAVAAQSQPEPVHPWELTQIAANNSKCCAGCGKVMPGEGTDWVLSNGSWVCPMCDKEAHQ